MVTDIIANAWAVNFTLNVESFENGNIKAIYHLLNLAIQSGAGAPANLFFSSSYVVTFRYDPGFGR